MHEAFSIRRLVIILEHVVARFSKAPVIQRARAESLIACWLGRKKRSERERRERRKRSKKRDGEEEERWRMGWRKRERERERKAAKHGVVRLVTELLPLGGFIDRRVRSGPIYPSCSVRHAGWYLPEPVRLLASLPDSPPSTFAKSGKPTPAPIKTRHGPLSVPEILFSYFSSCHESKLEDTKAKTNYE